MRSFLIKSSLITAFLILFLITLGIGMAVMAPFRPGNLLFPIQYFSEQQVKIVYNSPVHRSSYTLDILERRINDLSARTGTKYELIALTYLDRAIDQATLAISVVPQEEVGDLRDRLLSLAQRADEALKLLSIAPVDNSSIFIAFRTKIQLLMREGGLSCRRSGAVPS